MIIYNKDMLKNIKHVKTIKKGGDLNYILYEISNFYDINTKRNFNSLKFIENYYGILLEKFKIDKIDLFIDEDLLNIHKSTLAYHYMGNVYINQYLFKKPSQFFSDLVTFTHEFQHFIDFNNSNFIVRKIGENSRRLKLNFNDEVLKHILNITDPVEINLLYNVNECEHCADIFAYEYIIDLIEMSKKKIKQNSIEYVLLNMNKEKIENSFLVSECIYEKNLNMHLPFIQKKVKNIQEKWLLEFKECVQKLSVSKNKQYLDFLKKIFEIKEHLVLSFFVYENLNILNKMKNYALKFSSKNLKLAYFYIDCINYHNYIVTKQDIKNIINIFENKKSYLQFEDINLEQHHLKESILKIKFPCYDSKFEEIVNLDGITDLNSLLNSYKEYKNINTKNLKNNDNLFIINN